jgi:deleted-in-malignant-brain-tumors protein 1
MHSEITYAEITEQSGPDGVRLRNGNSPNEGLLEVLHEGRWGTVCDDGFDDVEAIVFCKLLGYKYVLSSLHHVLVLSY